MRKNIITYVALLLFIGIQAQTVSQTTDYQQTTDKVSIIGKWVNNLNDTLTFINTFVVRFKNDLPYWESYSYRLKGDSLFIITAANSNSDDLLKCYTYLYKRDSLCSFYNAKYTLKESARTTIMYHRLKQ